MHAINIRSTIQSPCRAFRRVSTKNHATAGCQLSPLVFPHSDTFILEPQSKGQQSQEVTAERLIEVLEGSVSPERLQKLQKVCLGDG